MTMSSLTLEQPPDWMRFTSTRQVSWQEVEATVARTQDEIAARYTLLVAILRAGSPIAALMAKKTGLPLDYLICNRRNPQPSFVDGKERAPHGHRLLLIDDVSGSGWTFARSRSYCEQLGNAVATFSIFHCDAPGMYVPDYSAPMARDIYLRWPWEYQAETEMPAPVPTVPVIPNTCHRQGAHT